MCANILKDKFVVDRRFVRARVEEHREYRRTHEDRKTNNWSNEQHQKKIDGGMEEPRAKVVIEMMVIKMVVITYI